MEIDSCLRTLATALVRLNFVEFPARTSPGQLNRSRKKPFPSPSPDRCPMDAVAFRQVNVAKVMCHQSVLIAVSSYESQDRLEGETQTTRKTCFVRGA